MNKCYFHCFYVIIIKKIHMVATQNTPSVHPLNPLIINIYMNLPIMYLLIIFLEYRKVDISLQINKCKINI